MTERTHEEIVEQIQSLLESHVKPAVAGHGGNIEFVSFEDNGTLTVMLGGACSGCAGSTMTLKMGVEQMMMHYIPEVKVVEAVDDPTSNVDPYYAMDPFMDRWDEWDVDDEDDDDSIIAKV